EAEDLIETSLDAYLQRAATEAVADGLENLRRRNRRLRSAPLSAALVVLDAETGDILAHVGGDPRGGDSFDRVRTARRQPGSAVKPLILLEAFEDCGRRRPLYPARSVSDRPLRIDLPSGPWTPVNPDGRNRPEVTVREAMVQSLNLPLVRVAEWCGRRNTARRMRRAGLALDKDPPPSFALGAIETSALELAAAYSALASDGRSVRPRALTSIRRPSGSGLASIRTRRWRVVSADTSYLIRDVLVEALEPRATGLPTEARPFGKTGTSSDRRDAWFAGALGSVVAVVWVGLDDGAPLGLFGSQAAFPMWSELMDTVARVRRTEAPPRPASVVERWIDEESGLLVQGPRRGASSDLFHDRSAPRQRKWWRSDPPLDPIG
ncbi:MAG: penicillin-binding transpeptidase domain-containing protein, partial [Acidobacteria bacterium]|nr:penicillin-binding transpeptidase domain-containing protein [Acidobacteriota bacterium]